MGESPAKAGPDRKKVPAARRARRPVDERIAFDTCNGTARDAWREKPA
jgi:hypothetical protein